MRDNSMQEMFRAIIAGKVKEFPIISKFVYKGETLAAMIESPTRSCHHGTNSETAITIRVVMPPVRPNQFILEGIYTGSSLLG